MTNLPNTNARLSTSVKFYYAKNSNFTPDILQNPQALQSLSWHLIDGVEKFHEVDDRITDPRYEVDGKKPGDIIGRIIKVVEKRLSIDRTVFYEDDVADFFDLTSSGVKDATKELINQTESFAIMKVEVAPKKKNLPIKTTIYLDCYIHNIPKTYELGRELKVMQSINLGYIDKITFEGATIV